MFDMYVQSLNYAFKLREQYQAKKHDPHHILSQQYYMFTKDNLNNLSEINDNPEYYTHKLRYSTNRTSDLPNITKLISNQNYIENDVTSIKLRKISHHFFPTNQHRYQNLNESVKKCQDMDRRELIKQKIKLNISKKLQTLLKNSSIKGTLVNKDRDNDQKKPIAIKQKKVIRLKLMEELQISRKQINRYEMAIIPQTCVSKSHHTNIKTNTRNLMVRSVVTRSGKGNNQDSNNAKDYNSNPKQTKGKYIKQKKLKNINNFSSHILGTMADQFIMEQYERSPLFSKNHSVKKTQPFRYTKINSEHESIQLKPWVYDHNLESTQLKNLINRG